MQRVDRHTEIPEGAVETQRERVVARTHPDTERGDRECPKAGRSLHLERQRLGVDVERQIVPSPYDVVYRRDIVLPGFQQDAGPIEGLAGEHPRYAVARGHTAHGDDRPQQDAVRSWLLQRCEHGLVRPTALTPPEYGRGDDSCAGRRDPPA